MEWKAALYQEVRQQMSTGQLAVYQICALAGVSRKGFYRFDPERVTADRDIDMRDAMQRIALEMPS